MIHWNPEKALNLRAVQIHGNDAVRPGSFDAIRADSRADRDAGFIFLIPFGISKIWDDHGDGACAGALEGIDPKEDFHQLVIWVKPDGLNQIDIVIADCLLYANEDIAIRKVDHFALSKVCPQIFAHFFCKSAARASGKYLDNISLFRMHFLPLHTAKISAYFALLHILYSNTTIPLLQPLLLI